MTHPLARQRIAAGPSRIVSVAAWELRYTASIAATWGVAGAAFFFFATLVAVRNTWGPLVGTTALGQLAELAYDLMLVLGVMLPFLVTDGVAHDRRQRMHELLMTSALPSWAYVWGRWLAALLVAGGLALLLLAAQVLVNFGLAALDPAQYPSANVWVSLSQWAAVVLPSSLLVCGLCFCLGTLWPRYTALPKLAVCVAWVILAFDQDPTDLSWRAFWNPTGAGIITLLGDRFQRAAQAAGQAASLLRLQQVWPDLRPWLGSYLTLAALGVVLGLVTVLGFRRFRDSL